MEENNKYWLEEKLWICVFCGIGRNEIEHYVEECRQAKDLFIELGENKKERLQRIWNDELEKKGKLLAMKRKENY